ncbi:MAG TPA: hypothetical protein VFS21_07935 [Roseiflexaceae bacterium]|nr:hypothetical protein [Roseiflexaceae bacterium]
MSSGTAELLERRVWRCWRDEGGRQAADTVAVIAVVLALMGALAVVLAGGGGQIGGAATEAVASFITSGAGQPQGGAVTAGRPDGSVDVAVVSVAAMGVPNLVLGQVSAPGQPAQQSCGFLGFRCWGQAISDVWNSLPGWLQGGLIALAAAVVVVAAFVVLVAAGVVTAVSLKAAAVIGAVALVVAFVAGAVYVLVTGRVDVLQLLGIGAGSALAVVLLSLAFVTGGLAAAWVALRAGAGRLWGAAVEFLWRSWAQTVRFAGWVKNTAWPWIKRGAGWLWNWSKTVAWPWIKYGPKSLAGWSKRHILWAAVLQRVVEEFAKGSYVEGLVFLVVVTAVSVFWKNPLILLAFSVLKGLYSRYKEDVHRWLSQWLPWLPKLP